jgi:hypothetical protein
MKNFINFNVNNVEIQKRIWNSSLKPLGIIGLLLFNGMIILSLLSVIHLGLFSFMFIFTTGIILINFEILKRIISKKADDVDKFIGSLFVFVIGMFLIPVVFVSIFIH